MPPASSIMAGLAQQYCARGFKFLDHRGVIVKALLSVRPCAPRSGITFDSEKVFSCIRDSVKRAAVLPCRDFFFRGVGLLQRQIGRERGIGIQFWANAAAAVEIAFSKFHG